jgi:hypothetical protein
MYACSSNKYLFIIDTIFIFISIFHIDKIFLNGSQLQISVRLYYEISSDCVKIRKHFLLINIITLKQQRKLKSFIINKNESILIAKNNNSLLYKNNI